MRRLLLTIFLVTLPCFAAEQAVAGNSRLLVFWNESIGEQWRFYAATSDFSGNQDPPVALAEDLNPVEASAATDGEQFLVAWSAGNRVYARLRDTVTLGEGTSPVAVWSGTHYLVFFGANVAVITPQGVVESIHAIAGVGKIRAVAIGPRPLVLWIDGLTLRAAFLTSDWTATDVVTLAHLEQPVGGGFRIIADPQVAWNGREFFATWRIDPATLVLHIEGTRITPDGVPLDHAVIYDGSSPGEFRNDALLVIGARFFKSWVGASARASHDFQGAWIEDGSASAFVRLPRDGTVVALPGGELAIVHVVNNRITIARLGGNTRRRSARA